MFQLSHLQQCEKGICHPSLWDSSTALHSAQCFPLQSFSPGAVGKGWRETTPHTDNHIHRLHQDTSLRGMQPGQDLSFWNHMPIGHEKEESHYRTALISHSLLFKQEIKRSKMWHFSVFLLVLIHRRSMNSVCKLWHKSNPTNTVVHCTPHVQPAL